MAELDVEGPTIDTGFGDDVLVRADLEPLGTEYLSAITSIALAADKPTKCDTKFLMCLIKAGKKYDECIKKAGKGVDKVKKCIDEHAVDLKKCLKDFEDCKKKK
ncbi:MAG: hypothetical protein NPIRA02_06560 [Nitrospirales bacterium]|nr:MAG: hypothetical protein NPIRA02_06560 [Nitrospirales bacterium]